MTDEEILKRLAEIEGWQWTDHEKLGSCTYVYDRDFGEFTFTQWNPLANWSDLGPLIEKYKPTIWHLDVWHIHMHGDGGLQSHQESLPRAICLAIIEAKGKT